MAQIIRVSYSEFSECSKMTFDPVQPRSISRQEDEFYIVLSAPRGYFFFYVRAEVVENNIKLSVVKRPHVFQDM